jgi:protein-S-isoprenylcysteine O-methyltransferase Ste14
MSGAKPSHFSCITIHPPRFVPSLFSDLPASHVPQIKAKNDQTMLKYGVYVSFAANALSLIRHPYLVQSSQRILSYVKVPLVSPDLLKHVWFLLGARAREARYIHSTRL